MKIKTIHEKRTELKTIGYHKPIQRDDGSIYCYCEEIDDETISCSVNWLTKKIMCSICRKEMNII